MRILPLVERGLRASLRRSGVATHHRPTPLGRLHLYEARGTGSGTIVLLHGISASAAPFAPLIKRLTARAARVIAIDLPGHGFSDPLPGPLTLEQLFETMTGVLGELASEPLVLVGNSLGGAIAARFATAHPEQVAALVLLSPGGAPLADAEWRALQTSFRIESRADALAFLARVQHRPRLLDHVIAHELGDAMRRPAVRDLLASATPTAAIASTELAALAAPVLLWWGRSERLLPASQLAWWRANLPAHAVVEEPEGIGHCPQLDDPGRVAARIAAFVAGVTPLPHRGGGPEVVEPARVTR